MVAPVLPAQTMAEALPSRTALAATLSEASFFWRTDDAGSSPISMTSEAGRTSRPWSVAQPGGVADEHDRDAQLVDRPPGAGDDRVGASSPPMASTATGSIDADRDWTLKAAALSRRRGPGGPCTSRRCRRPCGAPWRRRTGAERAAGAAQHPGGGPAAAALRLRGLLLGDGHRSRSFGPGSREKLPERASLSRTSARRGRPSGGRPRARPRSAGVRPGARRGRARRSRRAQSGASGRASSTASRTIGSRSTWSAPSG